MVDLTMSNLTGPEAPHYFRICLRSQIGHAGRLGDGASEISACGAADHRGYPPRPGDVVMVVKDRMASAQVSQIVLMLPEAARPALGRVDVQPTGSHARRPALDSDRKRVVDSATRALEAGAKAQLAPATSKTAYPTLTLVMRRVVTVRLVIAPCKNTSILF